MKNVLMTLVTLAMSATALAGHENVNMSDRALGQMVSLGDCKGSAMLTRQSGNLYLVVSNAQSCSNIMMDGKEVGKLEGGVGSESIALNERYGQNSFVVVAKSNSGKTSASISVSSFLPKPQPKVASINPNAPSDFLLSTYLFGRRTAALADCGGYVTLYKDAQDRAHLSFQNVQNCSNFDILKENGQYSNYRAQKIGNEANRSEDIVIPGSRTEYGGNKIKVVVKSNSAKTYDVFTVEFYKW